MNAACDDLSNVDVGFGFGVDVLGACQGDSGDSECLADEPAYALLDEWGC